MDDIIKQKITDLPQISKEAAKDYLENSQAMVKMVNDKLAGKKNVQELIGGNSLDKMFDNHQNHALFMYNVFLLNDYKLLLETIPWVLRVYFNRGFTEKYFELELKAWLETVDRFLKPRYALEINEVYSFLLENLSYFIFLAKKDSVPGTVPPSYKQTYRNFSNSLLDGDEKKSLEIARNNVESPSELNNFFENIIRPSLYEIGRLWEQGEITVAEEHLASSLVSRVIFDLYSSYMTFENSKGVVAISAVANELHEIGSRVVADSLELDGWDVYHLGADTPVDDLIEFLLKKQPFILGLSVGVSFNLHHLVETIEKTRSYQQLKNMKILVGGKILNEIPDLWEKTGADALARNSREAVQIAANWWEENKDEEEKHGK